MSRYGDILEENNIYFSNAAQVSRSRIQKLAPSSFICISRHPGSCRSHNSGNRWQWKMRLIEDEANGIIQFFKNVIIRNIYPYIMIKITSTRITLISQLIQEVHNTLIHLLHPTDQTYLGHLKPTGLTSFIKSLELTGSPLICLHHSSA